MKTLLMVTLSLLLLVVSAVEGTAAQEVIVLACSSIPLIPGPSVFVQACDKSAEVPGVCPVFTGAPEETLVSCAQTLAFFLSLPGYRLENVQPGIQGPTYTIIGRSRSGHGAAQD